MKRSYTSIFLATLMSILMLTLCGCSDDDDDSSSSTTSTGTTSSSTSYTGTWAMHPGSEASGTIDFYIKFNTDKTFTIARNPDGSDQIIYGTYTTSGATLEGPMVNPGVGDGKIVCSLSGGVITMDFIEYWNEPEKHLAFACNKVS